MLNNANVSGFSKIKKIDTQRVDKDTVIALNNIEHHKS